MTSISIPVSHSEFVEQTKKKQSDLRIACRRYKLGIVASTNPGLYSKPRNANKKCKYHFYSIGPCFLLVLLCGYSNPSLAYAAKFGVGQLHTNAQMEMWS
jgi:hypothetical protein